MFLVGGAVGLCLLLVAAAFAMQSRADAAAGDEVVVDELPEVVFAAETEAVREERRQAFAIAAPDTARAQLANLAVAVPLADDEIRSTAEVFDETAWTTATDDCLDQAEAVLVRRSSVPIVWADNLECVPADGRWFDHYLSVEIDRTIDAEVRHLIPPAVVHASGGASWTPATRAAYMADVAHPATIAVFVSGGGHNPRDEAPDVWRPSNEATWCGYAVDWVTVKTRWQLSVTDAERNALEEMLDSCNQPESTGAHVGSMLIEAIDEPTIERLDNG